MFLVLHGQTEWNRDRRMQGQHDSALTAEGARQGRAVGELLRSLLATPPRIVASPLGRTQATARILAACLNVPEHAIETDERLKEVALGEWEGLTREEIAGGWNVRTDDRTQNDWFFRAPGGESYDALASRLSDWLASLGEHDALIAVSHGVASRVLRGLYAGLSKEDALALEVSRDTVYRLQHGKIAAFKAS
jgi:broad specificity phosphatase PhoE